MIFFEKKTSQKKKEKHISSGWFMPREAQAEFLGPIGFRVTGTWIAYKESHQQYSTINHSSKEKKLLMEEAHLGGLTIAMGY